MKPRGNIANTAATQERRTSNETQLVHASASLVLERTRLVALDVDGVLTDGRIVYGPGGAQDELQTFDVRDGIALRWLKHAGIVVVWISGRGCRATEHRARELEIEEVHQQCSSKHDVLRDVQQRRGIATEETVAMGDDLPDLGLRARAAFFAVPSNARDELKERADLVTVAAGGCGAVREVCEQILRAQQRWQAILDAASQ